MAGSLVDCIERMLEINKVKEGGKVVLLTGPVYDADLIGKYIQALNGVGADFAHVVAPPTEENGKLTTTLLRDSLLWDTFKGDKLVLRLTSVHPSWGGFSQRVIGPKAPAIYSGTSPGSMYDILCSGTRWLEISVPDPEVNMRRLLPRESVVKRTYAGAKKMDKAKTIRIKSEAGSDLIADKSGSKISVQVGTADRPGRWDNYGVFMVATSTKPDSANGTLVITPGSCMPHMGAYCDFYETVKLTFKDGYITKVEGGGHARILERWLNRTGEKDAKALTGHIGWGTGIVGETTVMRDSADWYTYDYENAPFQVHFGRNCFQSPDPFCGFKPATNMSPSHGGPSCWDADFYLDDELIVKKGTIVHPDCK